MDLLMMLVIWYAVFLFSTTFHEAAHAFMAKKLGDETAYHAGQVTLDPIPHIKRELIGMVVVPLLSFLLQGGQWMLGWASAPYDPLWARQYPKKAAYMAAAGPIANLLLVIVAAGIIHTGLYFEIFFEPDKMHFSDIVGAYREGWPLILAKFAGILFSLNLLLFVFNLLPLPPLDGGSLYPFFVKQETAVKIMDNLGNPAFTLIGIVIAFFILQLIFSDIHLFAINMLYPDIGYTIKQY